jgi:uncharacterized membrane protein
MTVLALSFYEISLFLHIVAAVVGLGATFAMAIAFPLALRMDQRHLPYVHRLSLRLSQWFALPGLLVILATGHYQVIDGDWDFGAPWLSASMGIVFVMLILTVAYFIPADRKLGDMAQREIDAAGPGEVTLSEEYRSRAQREGGLGALTGFLVVVVVYLMVTKPGL